MTAIEVRLARSVEELRSAYGLLHDEYVRLGFQEPTPTGLRFLPQYALPETHTLVVLKDGRVIGAVTLVLMGRLGMPLQVEFHREILDLQVSGRRPVEVSGLAIRASGHAAVLPLFGVIYGFARYVLKATDLCITVNPAHEGFYRKALLFERAGPPRPSTKVNNAPAILLRLDLETVEERYAANPLTFGVGRVLAPQSAARKGTDFARRAEEVRRDLPEAVVARLKLVRELLTCMPRESSPARVWEPWQEDVIVRRCESVTRHYAKKGRLIPATGSNED